MVNLAAWLFSVIAALLMALVLAYTMQEDQYGNSLIVYLIILAFTAIGIYNTVSHLLVKYGIVSAEMFL